MGKFIDLKNQRFGFWVVLELAGKNKNGQTQWLCQCECGGKKIVTANSLRTGNSTSCGCNHTPDLTNEKFGQLTVEKLDSKNNGRRYWICQCNCGQKITASTYQLRNGLITSCGCAKNNTTDNNNEPYNPCQQHMNLYKNITQFYDQIDRIKQNTIQLKEIIRSKNK